MRNFLKNFGRKSRSAQKRKADSPYRLPDLVWMSDVKKASECGALLQKKGTSKKAPSF
jgi:hypothetical protein